MKTLFSSRARVEVLKLFLFNPDNGYYQRQISEITGLPIRAVQRELEKLGKAGLFTKSTEGNRVYFRINRGFPVFNELKSIFLKTYGIPDSIRKHLSGGGIKAAFIFGSYAKNSENMASDIDLFVVGSVTARELSSGLAAVRKETGREINYYLLSAEEFGKKISMKDHFVTSVVAGEKIFVGGDEHGLKTLAVGRKASKA